MRRMQHRAAGVALGAGLGLGVALAAATPAAAQGVPMPGQTGFTPFVKPDQTAPRTKSDAPSALPGARPGRGAAPVDKSVADLSPNDALFDAINRGDIGEARDAVSRGADIHAENVLGMTPLELSVDLSRNDITFFLLSLRGASGGALSPKAAVAAAASGGPAVTVKPAAKVTKLAGKAARPKPASASSKPYAISDADPGRPDPQAGFLGFGGGSIR